MIELTDLSTIELLIYGVSVVCSGIAGAKFSKNRHPSRALRSPVADRVVNAAKQVKTEFKDLKKKRALQELERIIPELKKPNLAATDDQGLLGVLDRLIGVEGIEEPLKKWVAQMDSGVKNNWKHEALPPVDKKNAYQTNLLFLFLRDIVIERPELFEVGSDRIEKSSIFDIVAENWVATKFKQHVHALKFEDSIYFYKCLAYSQLIGVPKTILLEDDASDTEILGIQSYISSASRSALALVYCEKEDVPCRLLLIRSMILGPMQSSSIIQFNTRFGDYSLDALPRNGHSTWHRKLLSS